MPTAIFAAHGSARGGLEAATVESFKVPDDLSVIGVKDK
jgi:DNA-binding LacI/PurR family transcriptional regulator